MTIGTIARQHHDGSTRRDDRRNPRRAGFAAVMVGWVDWLELQLAKRRSRRALMELSDYQLKDIGLSRSDAVSEGMRPFWD